MDNLMIKNAQGEQININVVRYFRLNGTEYLVFSLNEVDEGGYVKLYISKVNGNFANTITDDVEWNLIKDTIKTIIKSNKENMPLNIIDLDVRKLTNVQLVEQKVFKLSETFIQLLGANKKIEAYEEPVPSTELNFNNVEKDMVLDEIQLNPIAEPTYNDFVLPVSEEILTGPVAPQVEIPAIESNSAPQPSNEVLNSITVNPFTETPVVEEKTNIPSLDNSVDYKTLYENELNKNNVLTEEIEKYKNIINNLKNIVNETF